MNVSLIIWVSFQGSLVLVFLAFKIKNFNGKFGYFFDALLI